MVLRVKTTSNMICKHVRLYYGSQEKVINHRIVELRLSIRYMLILRNALLRYSCHKWCYRHPQFN